MKRTDGQKIKAKDKVRGHEDTHRRIDRQTDRQPIHFCNRPYLNACKQQVLRFPQGSRQVFDCSSGYCWQKPNCRIQYFSVSLYKTRLSGSMRREGAEGRVATSQLQGHAPKPQGLVTLYVKSHMLLPCQCRRVSFHPSLKKHAGGWFVYTNYSTCG